MKYNIDYFAHHSLTHHFLDTFYLQENAYASHPLQPSWFHPIISLTLDIVLLTVFSSHVPFITISHSPGLYSSRAELICTSVSAEVCSFCVTSSAVFLVLLSTIIKLSSSAREPLVLVSRNKRLSSSSFILLLFKVTSSIRSVLSFSNSCWDTW